MSPLQGRWVVEVTFPFVGASPYGGVPTSHHAPVGGS